MFSLTQPPLWCVVSGICVHVDVSLGSEAAWLLSTERWLNSQVTHLSVLWWGLVWKLTGRCHPGRWVSGCCQILMVQLYNWSHILLLRLTALLTVSDTGGGHHWHGIHWRRKEGPVTGDRTWISVNMWTVRYHVMVTPQHVMCVQCCTSRHVSLVMSTVPLYPGTKDGFSPSNTANRAIRSLVTTTRDDKSLANKLDFNN